MQAPRYRLIERIGQGGMATVWRAHDEALGRQVAVKLLLPFVAERPESSERFAREARALAGIRHPNVLQLFDYHPAVGEEPARLIMELLAGPSLQRFVVDAGAPLPEVAALVGFEVGSGLAAVHACGIVHRDVKPENVLLDAGRVVLTDFGVARVEVAERSALTQTGAIIGSPAYMSPEQARGDEVDARSDQFSLGSLMYFLATGAAPFTGAHPLVVMQKIDRGEFVPPAAKNPRVPGWLDRVIRRCLAHEPAQRYPDVGALVEALRRGLSDDGLDDAAAELRRYFADPPTYNAGLPVRITPLRLADAEAAATRNDRTRALASIERVLQLDPSHARAQFLFERLARPSRRGAAILAGLAVAACAIAAPRVWVHLHPATPVLTVAPAVAEPATASAPSVPSTPSEQPPAEPPHATAKLDHPRVSHVVRAAAPVAVASQPSAPPAPAPAPSAPLPTTGRLSVRTRPWCELTIDGESKGRTPQVMTLPSGRHAMRCVSAAGARLERIVDLAAGDDQVIEESLAFAELRPLLHRGDALSVDDDPAGEAARQVSVGRHRVRLFGHGNVLETRYLDVPPSGCRVNDTPDLHCESP